MGLRQRRLGEDLASQYRGKVAHLKTSISILLINCHPLPIFRTSYPHRWYPTLPVPSPASTPVAPLQCTGAHQQRTPALPIGD